MNRRNRYYSRSAVRSWTAGVPDKDPVQAAAERLRLRKIGEQAYKETMELFAPLTAANALAALAWQEQRIRELQAAIDI
jgi:hypothetical protein